MNRIFFLAAGFGKRMGTWTEHTPKPLLKIDQISFLDYALYLANQWGVEKSWINVHYLGSQIMDHLKNFTSFPLKISFEKNEILGTAGGIRSALEEHDFDSPIVLFNPDTLLFPEADFKIKNYLPKNSKIHLYLAKQTPNDTYTKIELLPDSTLIFGSGNLFYIGLAIIDPAILLSIPKNSYSDLSSFFKNLASEGKVTGEIFKGETLDLGEKKLYERFKNQNVFGSKRSEILSFASKYF